MAKCLYGDAVQDKYERGGGGRCGGKRDEGVE